MTSSHKALLESLLSSLGAEDVTGAAECFHPDAVIREADVLPYGGDHRGGPAAFLHLNAAIDASYIMAIGQCEVLDAADRVIVLADLTMTSKISGASLQTSLVEVFSFADGLIIEDDVYYKDAAAVARLHKQ